LPPKVRRESFLVPAQKAMSTRGYAHTEEEKKSGTDRATNEKWK
jgi:hypothetical protein